MFTKKEIEKLEIDDYACDFLPAMLTKAAKRLLLVPDGKYTSKYIEIERTKMRPIYEFRIYRNK